MPAGAADLLGRPLTEREVEIVSEIGVGKRNKEIADRFRCSHRTVETHVHNILKKLGLKTRNEICAWWHTQRNPNRPSLEKTAR